MWTRACRVAILSCVVTALARPRRRRSINSARRSTSRTSRQSANGRANASGACRSAARWSSPTRGRRRSPPANPHRKGLGRGCSARMNAPIQWGGVTWAAYIWDTLANAPPLHAKEILLHELFHGIVQLKLGLAASELLNEHLDVMDGRYWLRLECRALARALRESGAQRNARRPRRARLPACAAQALPGQRRKGAGPRDQRRRRLVHRHRGRGRLRGRRDRPRGRDTGRARRH